MLKIRLQRVGRKNDASFRLVVTEHTRGPKAGDNVEVLGSYDPKSDTKAFKADRVKHWISVGAQVSDTAHNLLVGEGIIDGKKINVLPKKSPVVDEEAVKAAEEAKKQAEEEAKADAEIVEESATEEATETPAEEPAAEEAPAEAAEDKKEEAPAEETKEEAVSDEDAATEESEDKKKDDK